MVLRRDRVFAIRYLTGAAAAAGAGVLIYR